MRITPNDDAFGDALRDHLEGRSAHQLILERDDGWTQPAMPPAAFFDSPDDWAPNERAVVAHVTDGPVLDLGCGAGRHALFLQDAGRIVTAVDLSPGAVEVTKARGVREARVADLRTPPDNQRWAAVLLMCGNLGLGGSWDGTKELLRDLAEKTTPDAVIVGDTVDPTATDDAGNLAYQARTRERGEYVGFVRLRLRYGEKATPWWDQMNFVASDIARVVDDTGWTIRDHIDEGVDQWVVLEKA